MIGRPDLTEWSARMIRETIANTRAEQDYRIRFAAATTDALDTNREDAWHQSLATTAEISPGAMAELVAAAELRRPSPRPFALVAHATIRAGQPLATVNR